MTSSGVLKILNGRHLKVSGNQFSPYVFSRVSESGVEKFAGANFEIIHASSQKCNFTYELDAPAGKGTGSRLSNGSWDGIFADVYYNRSDLAVVLGHTSERHDLVDFTSPFGAANLVFSTSRPSIRVKPNAILSSFTPTVWLYIALSLVGITLAVYVTSRVRHEHNSIPFALFYVYRILMEQEVGRIPSGLQVITSMYLAYVIIIGTGYKSNLLSALSFPIADAIPTTFQQLAERSEYEIYFDKSGTAGYNYFKKTNSPDIINIRRRFELHSMDGDPAECVVAAFVGTATACIAWDTVLNEVTARNLSLRRGLRPTFQTRQSLTQTWVTIGLQKNSRYTHAFSLISSSYYETGLVTKWHQDIVADCVSEGLIWIKSQSGSEVYKALTKILQDESKGARPLPLENMSVIFALFSLGMAIALLAFIAELLSLYITLPSIINTTRTGSSDPAAYQSQQLSSPPHGFLNLAVSM